MMPRSVTRPTVAASCSSRPIRRDRARVFELEVPADELLGVGVELLPLLVGELEPGELRVGGELGPGAVEVGERGVDRAVGPGPPHQVLEREVHERALAAGADGGSGSRSM